MRLFTFRFFHATRHYWREATIVGAEEVDATTAAWLVLARLEHQPNLALLRAQWRVGMLRVEALREEAHA